MRLSEMSTYFIRSVLPNQAYVETKISLSPGESEEKLGGYAMNQLTSAFGMPEQIFVEKEDGSVGCVYELYPKPLMITRVSGYSNNVYYRIDSHYREVLY